MTTLESDRVSGMRLVEGDPSEALRALVACDPQVFACGDHAHVSITPPWQGTTRRGGEPYALYRCEGDPEGAGPLIVDIVGPCHSMREAVAMARGFGAGHYLLNRPDGSTVEEFDLPPCRGALFTS